MSTDAADDIHDDAGKSTNSADNIFELVVVM